MVGKANKSCFVRISGFLRKNRNGEKMLKRMTFIQYCFFLIWAGIFLTNYYYGERADFIDIQFELYLLSIIFVAGCSALVIILKMFNSLAIAELPVFLVAATVFNGFLVYLQTIRSINIA